MSGDDVQFIGEVPPAPSLSEHERDHFRDGGPGEAMQHDVTCPLTRDVFEDPYVAPDGHSYEKEALLEYVSRLVKENKPITSPMTRELMRPPPYPRNLVLLNYMRNQAAGGA